MPVVPINRGGGGTAVGVSYVKASYDGDPNVLVLINPQTQLTPMQVAGAAGWRDLTPLTNIMVDDYTFITKDGAAYADAAGFIEAARAESPGTLTVGSAGTADDLAIALLERAGGVKLNIIRYNSGAEALTAVLGGRRTPQPATRWSSCPTSRAAVRAPAGPHARDPAGGPATGADPEGAGPRCGTVPDVAGRGTAGQRTARGRRLLAGRVQAGDPIADRRPKRPSSDKISARCVR